MNSLARYLTVGATVALLIGSPLDAQADAESADRLYQEGVVRLGLGEFPAALALFVRAEEFGLSDRVRAKALREQGVVLTVMGEPVNAAVCFMRALRTDRSLTLQPHLSDPATERLFACSAELVDAGFEEADGRERLGLALQREDWTCPAASGEYGRDGRSSNGRDITRAPASPADLRTTVGWWLTGGGGAVAAGGAVALITAATSLESRVQHAGAPDVLLEARRTRDSVQVTGAVLAGLGAAASIGGLYLLLSRSETADQQAHVVELPAVGLAVGEGSVHAFWTGRFR